MLRFFVGLWLAVLVAAGGAQAQSYPARPSGPVLDQAGLLTPGGERRIEMASQRIFARSGDAVVVVTVHELGGMSPRAYATALANRWGVGDKQLDNGVLILVAARNRQMFIATGLGLDGLLTEARLRPIITRMTAKFRTSDFEGGLMLGMMELERHLLADRRRPYPARVPRRKAA